MARKCGDRRDGKLIRELDSLHFITGVLYPNRCDNEAFISVTIDLTNLNKYLEEKNAKVRAEAVDEKVPYKYNVFQCIVTALVKAITLRPKMNRFIQNCNFYQRNEVSASFVVKKSMTDSGDEALAFLHTKPEDNLDSVHEAIRQEVMSLRKDKVDGSTNEMNIFNKMPRWLSKFLIRRIMWLDRIGKVPASLVESDPYYSSVVISNLGSIRLKAGYHHLTNWGTCSIICLIGEKKKKPFFDEDGKCEMRDTIELGLTVDERIADGFYYSKTVRLIKKLLENPELLETALSEEVVY